jgi:hypothetical protein
MSFTKLVLAFANQDNNGNKDLKMSFTKLVLAFANQDNNDNKDVKLVSFTTKKKTIKGQPP